MPFRLPSLNALRTFEAAARHESIKRAAEELSVTPVAVTRQVHALEREFGVAFFDRYHQKVVLTEAGRDFAADLTTAFAAVHTAVGRMWQRAGYRVLHIGCESVFAKRWLASRLALFHEQQLKIRVELMRLDEENTWLDGVIQYSPHADNPKSGQVLFRESVFPVVSPKLLSDDPELCRPTGILRHRILHESSVEWWNRWQKEAGVEKLKSDTDASFMGIESAFEAVKRGDGILMGDDVLMADELLSGELVKPFSVCMPGGTYSLVRQRPDDEAMSVFVEWLLALCQRHKDEMKRILDL